MTTARTSRIDDRKSRLGDFGWFILSFVMFALPSIGLGDDRTIREGAFQTPTESANLDPTAFVHVVREDPRNAAVLFAGTERGVWWSANRGVAWEPFPAHLPPSAVRDLLVQPDAGDLIAGTHGRGVWIFDDLRALEGRANAEAAGLSVFPPRDAVLAQRDTPTTDTQAAGTNPEGPAAITFYQRALNVLDNLRLQLLPARAETLDAAAGDTAFATRLRALAGQSADIERVLTSQPQNS